MVELKIHHQLYKIKEDLYNVSGTSLHYVIPSIESWG